MRSEGEACSGPVPLPGPLSTQPGAYLETYRMIDILFWLLSEVLYWYMIIVIAAAVFSMLAGFGIVDTRNRLVWSIGDFLYRATEPALRPIRNILPNFGSIDLSPLVLLLLLQALSMLLGKIHAALLFGSFRPLL